MVPEPVVDDRVVSAGGAEEEADGDHQKEPAERVSRLPPGHYQPDTRARNTDHQGHDPVTHLVGQQGQRDRGRQGPASQNAQHHQPDHRRRQEREAAARAPRRHYALSARRLHLTHDCQART